MKHRYKNKNKEQHGPVIPKVSQLLVHILPLFRQYKLRLLVGFCALLCVDFLQLTIPRILKKGVDSLTTGNGDQRLLLYCALFILLIAIGVTVLRFLWRYTLIGFSRYLERAIRNRIFSHILKMDMSFFEKRTTGDIMAHSSNDLIAVQMACGMGMVAAVDAIVMTVAATTFMCIIHFKLAMLALLPMPFLVIATKILSEKLHKRFASVQDQFALLTEFSRSTLVSVRLIKAYTMEHFQTKEFDKLGKKYVRENLRVAKIQGLMFPIATLVGNLGMLLVLFFGGRLAISGDISMGDFVAFITYLHMLIWPMMAIGWVANLDQRGITSLTRIDELLSEQSQLKDSAKSIKAEEAHFSLKNLDFAYPYSENQALTNISLELTSNIYGFTGRTGSGKSTLCKVLARLYPVPDNSLFFSGYDVNAISIDSVRSSIGYVGQEPMLFSHSIAENIKLGSPDCSDEEMITAAKLAAIHDDIMSFPDQYDSIIGERGVKLSGGQKQRLSLARALLLDRPVLIIDDGLSAVDVETEHEIFDRLRLHFKNKCVIAVSNRLKLLSMTDHIFIFDEGKISYQGNHQQLLQTSPLYKAMYAKQMHEKSSTPAPS